jgi:hypothetical protein
MDEYFNEAANDTHYPEEPNPVSVVSALLENSGLHHIANSLRAKDLSTCTSYMNNAVKLLERIALKRNDTQVIDTLRFCGFI